MARSGFGDGARSVLRSHPVTAAALGLSLAGLVAGLVGPSLTFYWEFPAVAVLAGLATLVAAVAARTAYDGRTWPVPLFAVAPFAGTMLGYAYRLDRYRYDGVVEFAGELFVATLALGASCGLAGGVVGYLGGTAVRAVRVEETVPRDVLARRLLFVGLATAVAVALLAWLWIHRGLGDAA